MGIVSTYIVPHPPLIIPDIGRGQEHGIADTIESFNKIAREISEIKPDTIVVLTSHSIMYDDYIHVSPGKKASGDFRDFGYKNVSIDTKYDQDLVSLIEDEVKKDGIAAGTMGEQNKKLD